jgi:transposase
MSNSNITICGVDVSKAALDAFCNGARIRVTNDTAGIAVLAAWCRDRGAERVALEATGRYSRTVAMDLSEDGFTVHVVQPAFVKRLREGLGRRAKTDMIDAEIIAIHAALLIAHEEPQAYAATPLQVQMDQYLTRLRQIELDLVRAKTRKEGFTDEILRAEMDEDIANLKARRMTLIKALNKQIAGQPEFAQRLKLLLSIPGIGQRTALTLLIAMPELGTISREKIAALAGLAPFDNASGLRDSPRHIAGGRADVRTSLYAAALPAAFKHNSDLKAFYKRLTAAGKHHKTALVATARKLLITANAILSRGTPWTSKATTS